MQCRKVSGSNYSTNIIVPNSAFKLVSGEPKNYTFTQESGLKFTTMFCENCGSAIGKSQTGGKEFEGLTLVFAGSLDEMGDANKYKPNGEIWIKHRVSWLASVDGAVQAQEFA
jgi:hypothetical protein